MGRDVTRPLRVAVTRPRGRSSAACAELRARGFIPVVRSLVRPEADAAQLAAALDDLARDVEEGADAWLVFTSAEAVRALDGVRRELARTWPAVRVACVGPATAAAAERAGLHVSVVPPRYDGAALADALLSAARLASARADARTAAAAPRFHWPRAEGAGPDLSAALTSAGGIVIDTVAYRTLPDARGGLRLKRDIDDGAIDAVLFFSPSAVDAFVALAGLPPAGLITGVIGGTTAARARQYGITVHAEPRAHTITSLADALLAYTGRPVNREQGT